MKDVKVVIGANYGDEGKGLITRHFAIDAVNKGESPIVIFHNGTAQRGHTVDYTPTYRHIYHHFSSATREGIPTYFSHTFMLHPMTFSREAFALVQEKCAIPQTYYSPLCRVITPFDIAVDHMTEIHLQRLHGEREFGSCGFGSWCASERNPALIMNYNVSHKDFKALMKTEKDKCLAVLIERNVDIESMPLGYADVFREDTAEYVNTVEHFYNDVRFFLTRAFCADYDSVWRKFDCHIFENGQGLGLDVDNGNEWHTTSHTGLINPLDLLKDKSNYSAEACYVTRSYLTRHGTGPLEESVKKTEINAHMRDKTNLFNAFQGGLRYGFIESAEQKNRIENDWLLTKDNSMWKKTLAVTHTNEFSVDPTFGNYFSDNPFSVEERR